MVEAVICDYGRTIVDPDVKPLQFLPGVKQVLKDLKERGLKMALVSRGKDFEERKREFSLLELQEYFDVFDIVGPGGDKDFTYILEQLEVEAKNCVVVGDRVRSEIIQGNKVGAITVWLRQGKFADEKPNTSQEKPSFEIDNINELIPIVDNLI